MSFESGLAEDVSTQRVTPATEKGFHNSTRELADGVQSGEVDMSDFEEAEAKMAEGEAIAEPAPAEIVEYTPEQIAQARKDNAAIIGTIKPLESQVRAATDLQAQLVEQGAQMEVEAQGGMTEDLLHRLAALKGSRESNNRNLTALTSRLGQFKQGFFEKTGIPYDVIEGD